MTEAGQLLARILETGDIVGRDAAGRAVLQLALDDADLDALCAFGADAAESEDCGDDEPPAGPPVSHCWYDAA
jgi:hypothetical protein